MDKEKKKRNWKKTILIIILLMLFFVALPNDNKDNNLKNNNVSSNSKSEKNENKRTSSTKSNNTVYNKYKSLIKEKDVYNGFRNEKIEKMGYIKTSKVELKKAFKTHAKEFTKLMDYIENKDYNYFVFVFNDQTGLFCSSTVCDYEDVIQDEYKDYIRGGNQKGLLTKGNDNIYKYESF